ncbi:DNA repair metallo-beta-lactamase-domain-containing protein [Lipomyces oligophaga]|uniref:DNA repair metallo-beta-lactamase-domain-containing protein n=1 Tax=Lipomyces oligophaga TaxID=45792 RepID=UPI0034CF6135
MNISPGVAVDAFRYGRVPGIEMYFLTHFHSDHYGGLTAGWANGKIYCSEETGNLVIQQLNVSSDSVVKLPTDRTTDLGAFKVTLIDANHCPGSVLFLFDAGTTRILHTGDFRANRAQLSHACIRDKYINTVYLDTTYLNPKYTFPSQELVVQACAELCLELDADPGAAERRVCSSAGGSVAFSSQSVREICNGQTTLRVVKKLEPSGQTLVIVGTYSIGKERLAIAIAKILGTKIFAMANKRRIYNCLTDPDLAELVTDDPMTAQVHVVSLQEIRADTLREYSAQFGDRFNCVVGFRPTGWTYTSTKASNSEQNYSSDPRYLRPGRGSTSKTLYFNVPYSEHSSFSELEWFCKTIIVGKIIPTVNVGTASSRDSMKGWIDKWIEQGRTQRRIL